MFKKLLVPLDGSPLAEQALGAAAAIARASGAQIDVVLVHQPVPFAAFADAPWETEQAKDEEEYLATIAAELGSGASVSATHALLHGEVIETICARVRDIQADLIVMTSHGRTGLSRTWLGSVADGVLRRSAIPVLMLRPLETRVDRRAAQHLFQRILVPLDGSALAQAILPTASELARCGNARLALLRVVQPVPLVPPDAGAPFVYSTAIQDEPATKRLVAEAEQQLTQEAHTLTDQGFSDVKTRVVVAAHVAQAIIDFAAGNGVDAIAMSTHGRGASRLLVGSVSDKVLRASALPMLLRRPIGVKEEPDFISSASIAGQLPALANA
jgi:nucleotide-binding universal stress UspA family protein